MFSGEPTPGRPLSCHAKRNPQSCVSRRSVQTSDIIPTGCCENSLSTANATRLLSTSGSRPASTASPGASRRDGHISARNRRVRAAHGHATSLHGRRHRRASCLGDTVKSISGPTEKVRLGGRMSLFEGPTRLAAADVLYNLAHCGWNSAATPVRHSTCLRCTRTRFAHSRGLPA